MESLERLAGPEPLPWYRQAFGEDYLAVYAPFLTPERTAREAEELVRLLALPARAAVLDLACGQGRHAVALARRGFRVTGQDLSEVLLRRAEAAASAQGVSVRWVHGDMREIPFEAEFDAVVNLYTAFGYLESEADDARVLGQVRKALKPGGTFLLDTLGRDGLVRRFRPDEAFRRADGTLVVREHRFDAVTARWEMRTTRVRPAGSRAEFATSVRLYTPGELGALCAVAGLRVERWYGGLDGAPLELESPRLVVVCRRPATPAPPGWSEGPE